MKTLRSALAAVLLFVAAPAFAQWQTPNHSVPVGRGGGIQGFGNALPGVAGQPLVSTGPTTDPNFGNIANSGFAAGAADTYKGSLERNELSWTFPGRHVRLSIKHFAILRASEKVAEALRTRPATTCRSILDFRPAPSVARLRSM